MEMHAFNIIILKVYITKANDDVFNMRVLILVSQNEVICEKVAGLE